MKLNLPDNVVKLFPFQDDIICSLLSLQNHLDAIEVELLEKRKDTAGYMARVKIDNILNARRALQEQIEKFNSYILKND